MSYLIKKIKVPEFNDHLPAEETEILMRKKLARYSLDYLSKHYENELKHNPALQQWAAKWAIQAKPGGHTRIPEHTKEIFVEILEKQRQLLLQKNKMHRRLDEEIVRKMLHQIDLEEEKIRRD